MEEQKAIRYHGKKTFEFVMESRSFHNVQRSVTLNPWVDTSGFLFYW